MDVDVSRWVLELLLRCPEVGDGIAKLPLSLLPLPDGDPFLLKSVALRSIRSEIDEASISEKLLDFIEVVEVIDRNAGHRITELMKEAYCAVAVECSVRYIHGGRPEKQGKFAKAVRRIWTGRIRAMEKSTNRTELVTPKLLESGRRIEVAVGDRSECLNLMGINSRADAFGAVRVYLTDTLDKMRPSFLEALAVRLGLGVPCSTHEESRMHDDDTESARQAGARVNRREESTLSAPAKCTETNVTEDPRSASEPSGMLLIVKYQSSMVVVLTLLST